MNKSKLIFLVVAFVLLVPCLSIAVLPGPHDPKTGNGYQCTACHTQGLTYGALDQKFATNYCFRCHSAGGDFGANNAKSKFETEDYANPYNTTLLTRGSSRQTSHKWFGSVTSANAKRAGVVKPVDTDLNGLNKDFFGNLGRGLLFCNRCHNVHGNSGPQSQVKPYLRAANDSDQMCRNCHRLRDSKDHKLGSHPVNVSYTSAKNKIKNANGDLFFSPVTNQTNSTAEVKLKKGLIVCSTCHGAHNADSRSSTFDPFSSNHAFGQISSSDGTLLRVDPYGKTADSINICTNCHEGKKNHNLGSKNGTKFVQCNDCHSAHVDYDPAATGAELLKNVNLVRRYLDYSTAGRVSKRVFYRYTGSTTKEFYNAAGKGICQSCHLPPVDHYVDANRANAFPDAGHTKCNTCHNHKEQAGSFSYGVGTDCLSACHGSPPVGAATTAAGYTTYNEALTPHASHASGGAYYTFTCDQCHKGATMPQMPIAPGNFTEVFKNHTGIYAGPTASYSSSTCNNVYCHSSGAGTFRTVQWSDNSAPGAGGLNSIMGQAGATRCAACHDHTTIATGSHAKHVGGMQYGCVSCHATTVVNNTTLQSSARSETGDHVNTIKDVNFSGVAPATGTTCANIACHSNGKAAAPIVLPVWGSASTGACNTCHLTGKSVPVLATGSHLKHFGIISSSTGTANPLTVCARCHIYTAETGPTHANGTINVTTGCSTCHSDPYSTATVTPTWGTSSPGCGACHNAGGAFTGTGSAPATGGHNKHMALSGALCNQCHAAAVANTNGGTAHTDGDVDVTNNGYPANVTKHAAGSYTGTCSASSCHVSSYSGAYVTTTVWGSTAAGCTVCHTTNTGGTPPTGNHAKHMALTGALCSQCHAGATKDANGGTAHIDGDVDVTNGYPANVAKHAAGTYSGTCSSAACHVSPYTTSVVTTTAWGSTGANGCLACHTGPGALTGTGSGPVTGSHNKHMALVSSSCSQCHTGATANSTGGGASHVDGDIDVTNGYPANVAKHAIGSYTGTCSASSCHISSYGSGYVTSPAWGTASTCNSCHVGTPGQFTGDGSPNTGSHGKHMALIGALCNQCHTGAVSGSTGGGATHMDGDIDVTNGYPANIAKHAAGTYSGTCSTSCHSSPYGTSLVTTTAWGSNGANGCLACHTGTPGALTGTGFGPATGSHNLHMSLSGSSCNQCHAGATANVTGGSTHANGNVDVTGGYPTTVAKHAIGTYSGTCSTTLCHGSTSPVWGVNSANDTCTKCHGTPTGTGVITAGANNRYLVAPKDAAGLGSGKVSRNLKTGAHETHLRFLNGFSNYSTQDFRCASCHGSSYTGYAANHADGISAPAFQGMATRRNNMLPAWTAATVTCSNTYCHNPAGTGGTMNPGNIGTRTFVSWTSSSYLGDTAKTATNCNRCHKSPGSGDLAGGFAHTGMPLTDNCVGCHEHNGDTAGSVGRRHMDGIKYGGGGSGCKSCHGYPPLSATEMVGAGVAGTFADASNTGYTAGAAGKHRIHLDPNITEADAFAPCMPCHDLNTHGTGGATVSQVNVDVNVAADTNYRFDSTRSKRYNKAARTCSNVSCHFQPTAAW